MHLTIPDRRKESHLSPVKRMCVSGEASRIIFRVAPFFFYAPGQIISHPASDAL